MPKCRPPWLQRRLSYRRRGPGTRRSSKDKAVFAARKATSFKYQENIFYMYLVRKEKIDEAVVVLKKL